MNFKTDKELWVIGLSFLSTSISSSCQYQLTWILFTVDKELKYLWSLIGKSFLKSVINFAIKIHEKLFPSLKPSSEGISSVMSLKIHTHRE